MSGTVRFGFVCSGVDISSRDEVGRSSMDWILVFPPSAYDGGTGGSSRMTAYDGTFMEGELKFSRYSSSGYSGLGASEAFDREFRESSAAYKCTMADGSSVTDAWLLFPPGVSMDGVFPMSPKMNPPSAWIATRGESTELHEVPVLPTRSRRLKAFSGGVSALRYVYLFEADGGAGLEGCIATEETERYESRSAAVPGRQDRTMTSLGSLQDGTRGITRIGGTPAKEGFVPQLGPDGMLDESLLPNSYGSLEEELYNHVHNLENPHQVTKGQVGLGNVDDTSDMDKPVSNAVQEALDDIRSSISSVFRFVGYVDDYPDLPMEGNRPGDVYGVRKDGMNVVWVEDSNDSNDGYWDDLGASLEGYATKEEVRFEAGTGTDSAVQKQSSDAVIGLPVGPNSSVSTNSVAEGAGNVAGLRGYRYTDTGTVGNSLTFAVEPDGWAVGDVVSVINKSKYPDAGVITSIDGKTVTFESELSIGATFVEESDFDSKCAYVSAKPDKGDVDLGAGAHAEGVRTRAVNTVAHAEGRDTAALGQYSHSEGRGTEAQYCAHAEGNGSKALGQSSHAEGIKTEAKNNYEHAEGCLNASHTGPLEKDRTRHSIGIGPDAEHRKNAVEIMVSGDAYLLNVGGYDGTNPGSSSSVQIVIKGITDWFVGGSLAAGTDSSTGYRGVALGYKASTGENNTGNTGAVAIGNQAKALAEGACQIGWSSSANTTANTLRFHNTVIVNQDGKIPSENLDKSFVDKTGDTMRGGLTVPNLTVGSRVDGSTVGESSTAEGIGSTASGAYSHAEGSTTAASGLASHAEGDSTTARDYCAHAEGESTTADGESSHAEGVYTTADGYASHAEGSTTVASGASSHAEGMGTITQNEAEHAQGQYNASHTGATDAVTTIHSIGVGTEGARANAVEIMRDGSVFLIGVGGYNGTNPTGQQNPATDLATVVNGKAASADLATVATTGSYNDLSDKPAIPAVPVKAVKRNGTALVPDAQGAVNVEVPTTAGDVGAANQTALAAAFTAKAYAVGELATYNGLLYRCKSEYTATAQDPKPNSDTTHWEAAVVAVLLDGKVSTSGGTMTGDLQFGGSAGISVPDDRPDHRLPISDNYDENIVYIKPTRKTDNASLASLLDIAPKYSSSTGYAVGELCVKDDELVKCTTAGTGSAAVFTAATVEDALSAIRSSIPDISGKLDATKRNLLDYTTGTTLALGTAVYRSSLNEDGTFPEIIDSAIPTTSAYYMFELEMAVPSTVPSTITGPTGWTWLDGHGLPDPADLSGGETIYVACRLDCATRAVTANVWRVA